MKTQCFFDSLTQGNYPIVINPIFWTSWANNAMKHILSTKKCWLNTNFQGEELEDKSLLSKHFQVLQHHQNQFCCLFFAHFVYISSSDASIEDDKQFKFRLLTDLLKHIASLSIKAPSSSIFLSVQT